MLILMLTRRLQVLIDDERLRRLEAEAGRRQVPVSVVVRDAIDAAFPVNHSARSRAAAPGRAAPQRARERRETPG